MRHDIETLVRFAQSHGASDDFIRVLQQETDGRHLARRKTELALKNGRAMPQAWGHFLTALWKGNRSKALARADGTNTKLMEKAGINPEHSVIP